MNDAFELYDLKVETVETDRPFVCSHHAGDYFLVQGENLIFPETNTFSMYALSAILPLLPAKQKSNPASFPIGSSRVPGTKILHRCRKPNNH